MKKKLSALVISFAMIAVCISLIAGATFALFTSESGVNVAVSSAKVNVVASIGNVQTKDLNSTYADGSDHAYGTITVDGNAITLANIVPGDGVKFDIAVTNNSNVAIKYRTVVATQNDTGLFAALSVKIDGPEAYEGFTTRVSKWQNVEALGAVEGLSVEIEIPAENTDSQGLSCEIVCTVEAVQGNAIVEEPVTGAIGIFSKNDMFAFARSANAGNDYYKKTVVLGTDIDMENTDWTPITLFRGTFDGQGYAIKNLKIDTTATNAPNTGLFGKIDEPAVVKNVNIVNANVKAIKNVGVIAGGWRAQIDNCHISGDIKVEGHYKVGGIVGDAYTLVTNCSVIGNDGSYIIGTYLEDELEGDNVGGIAGFTGEKNNTSNYNNLVVKNVTISGARKVGGVIGYLSANNMVENAVVENVTVSYGVPVEYAIDNAGKISFGGIVGEYIGIGNAVVGCTISDSTINGCEVAKTGVYVGSKRIAANEDAVLVDNTSENVTVNIVTYVSSANLAKVSFLPGATYKFVGDFSASSLVRVTANTLGDYVFDAAEATFGNTDLLFEVGVKTAYPDKQDDFSMVQYGSYTIKGFKTTGILNVNANAKSVVVSQNEASHLYLLAVGSTVVVDSNKFVADAAQTANWTYREGNSTYGYHSGVFVKGISYDITFTNNLVENAQSWAFALVGPDYNKANEKGVTNSLTITGNTFKNYGLNSNANHRAAIKIWEDATYCPEVAPNNEATVTGTAVSGLSEAQIKFVNEAQDNVFQPAESGKAFVKFALFDNAKYFDTVA